MKRTATLLIGATALAACTTSPPVTAPQQHTATELVTTITKAVTTQPGYRFEVVPGGVTAPSTGVVRLSGTNASLDARTTRPVQSGGTPEQLHIVSTSDDAAYVELPPIFGLPPDKPWVKVNRTDTDEFTSTMLGFHDVIHQQAVFTKYHLPIVAAGGKVTLIAEQDTRHRYAITVDYQKAYNALTDENLRYEVKLALDQQVTTTTGEIELDQRSLPTRITFKTQFSGRTIVHEATFTDWGTTAPIAAPQPASISPRQ